MSFRHSIRFTEHFRDVKSYDTSRLRETFLVDNLFEPDGISLTYSHYDRFIIGGAMPVSKPLQLETFPALRSEFFLLRREMGIINTGSPGKILADGKEYMLQTREALYLGAGVRDVSFLPSGKEAPSRYYFNSTSAHKSIPSRKVSLAEAETSELGTPENANQRTIRKLLVASVLPTCQLQMGLTDLKSGSIWNTQPPHTHDRRMEVYFYFDIPEDQAVCHFMGRPDETRHIWMKNNQAVISPPWSIHSGAGTRNYSFIWGMAGENMDYTDMDPVAVSELR